MDPPTAPTNFWTQLLLRPIQRFSRNGSTNASESRIRRRRAVVSFITRRLWLLQLTLFCTGYLWLLIIPSPRLGRRTYIDENALQPGQVNTYWNWGDVHAADKNLAQLEALRDSNATSKQRAEFIRDQFHKLGVSASTQNYAFSTGNTITNGTNVYGIIASPRAPGTEAMVISASWLSRTGDGDGTLNLRGVSTVLALAGFLKGYSLWAKDIVLVVSDGHLDGMHAWLAAYHGSTQSNLQADHLDLPSGVIWTALNIDYPGHSFSHLGIFFEGNNGRLPNQDLLNSFQRISLYTGGVPVLVYDHLDSREHPDLSGLPPWIPTAVRKHPEVQSYVYQAKNVVRHFSYQARGRPSGVHGLFHQFRIDAITLFAVPATGPHGFHAIGRVIESTLRTTNNLLERLHASFFFYILTGADRFLKIGSYLPSAILISIAMMFNGLRIWSDLAWSEDQPEIPEKQKQTQFTNKKTWTRRTRPVIKVLAIMIATHVYGAFLFAAVTSLWFSDNPKVASPLVFTIFAFIPLIILCALPSEKTSRGSLSATLKALNLCLASTVISITALLNFSLATLLTILMGVPLSISATSKKFAVRFCMYNVYIVLGIGWLFLQDETLKAVWHWEILSIWFAPFVCLVYTPLVLQAGLVCLLPQ
ncbi:Gaa1-domain-containing protein [Collybia nuda]|uniref:Gaa1-domain-containing protein n=1 Tax=Collybia nuda TaxID=64659 RepID=A0A9P6CR18_9AGAR|nr:Gaa1-domain-containing protein [Collybia nuda]